MMTVKQKITELLKRLNDGVIEKEEVLALSLLSAVAGESIFLLGAPGVAKSLVARRLKYAFKDGSSFEYLMNRFSTPDEIFGPVSISKLKDHDKYERIVENYLPAATVVFLDEIWKAGPSIQNALLTVLNEKIYRNGEQEIQVPMKALISASNELPSKGEGLEALWDRFLFRLIVEGVKDKQSFNDMISKKLNSYSDTVGEALKISDDEYKNWNNLIEEIEIPENVFNVIHVIRSFINQYNQREENKQHPIYISDRRWRKIVRLLRTSAFLNDRKAVDLMDCFMIKDCLWNEVEQLNAATQFVNEAIHKHGYNLNINLNDLSEEITKFDNEVKEETSYLKPIINQRLKVYDKDYYKILENIKDFSFYIKISEYNALDYDNFTKVTFYQQHQRTFQKNYSESRVECRKVKQTSNILNNDSFLNQKRMFGRVLNNSNPKQQFNGNQNYSYKNTFVIEVRDNKYMNSIFTSTLETEEYKGTLNVTKKPHPATKEHWDKNVSKFQSTLKQLKNQIENYRNTDLKHIRTNLFVNSNLSFLVERNLFDLEKEIEKFEIEVNRIKHFYENIQEGEIIPQIENEPEVLNSIKEIDLSLLSNFYEQWVIREFNKFGIKTSTDFKNRDLDWFIDNTEIDEDLYYQLQESIENLLEDNDDE